MIALNQYNAIILLLSISDYSNVTCIPEENKLSKINYKFEISSNKQINKINSHYISIMFWQN